MHGRSSVWSVSDQSGKCEQRTRWKALLTSETAMQLRAARPMCGSGTLVKILGPDRRTVLIFRIVLDPEIFVSLLISWFFLFCFWPMHLTSTRCGFLVDRAMSNTREPFSSLFYLFLLLLLLLLLRSLEIRCKHLQDRYYDVTNRDILYVSFASLRFVSRRSDPRTWNVTERLVYAHTIHEKWESTLFVRN